MNNIKWLEAVLDALRDSWGADTAQNGDFRLHCPAYGQCVPTALVVQDIFGGDIIRSAMLKDGVEIGSHYYNRVAMDDIDDSVITLDLSGRQFELPELEWVGLGDGVVRDRDELLQSEDVTRRYHILLERVLTRI